MATRDAVVRTKTPGAFRTEIGIGGHALVSDVPRDAGGEDTGPEPHELLEAALGACTVITVTMYAKRKQWPLDEATCTVRYEKVEAAEKFTRELKLEGALDAEQRARLLDIANKCPVHKTLSAGAKIETRAVS